VLQFGKRGEPFQSHHQHQFIIQSNKKKGRGEKKRGKKKKVSPPRKLAVPFCVIMEKKGESEEGVCIFGLRKKNLLASPVRLRPLEIQFSGNEGGKKGGEGGGENSSPHLEDGVY